MSAIESRTMSPAATSQMVTCCVVLNEIAPVAASTCAIAAKSATEIETIFVTLRGEAEMASPSSFFLEKIDRSQLLSMAFPHFPIELGYHPLEYLYAHPVLEEITLEP
jgi:hypothetical protein